MVEDTNTGVWSVTGDSSLNGGAYYQYQVSVYHPESKKVESLITTDPYSLSMSVNSKYSQVVDLNDSATQPKGWTSHQVPTVKNVEDNIFFMKPIFVTLAQTIAHFLMMRFEENIKLLVNKNPMAYNI